MNNPLILLEALLFIYVSLLVGKAILRVLKISIESTPRRVAYAIMLGYGIFGVAGLLLGLMGLFNTSSLWIFVLAVVLVSLKLIRSHLKNLKTLGQTFPVKLGEMLRENAALKLIVIIWLLLNTAIAFVPLTGHDTLDYHFPIMESIVREGHISFTSAISGFDHLPILGEILYATTMGLFKNSSAPFVFQLLQYSTLPLLLLVVYDFARKRLQHKIFIPLLMLSILLLMDLEREVLHGGYVDVLAFLFGIASTLLIIEQWEREKPFPSELYLSAIFLGLALSVKYTAGVFAVINVLFLCAYLLRKKTRSKEALLFGVEYLLIPILIAGFWYLKNLLWFGNPLYPMFSNEETTAAVNTFLIERTFLNFFAFPFYRYAQWFLQENETSSRLIVLGYFIFAYTAVLYSFFFSKKSLKPTVVLLFLFIELYLLFLFFTSHQYRFLIPATIALPILIVVMIDNLYAYLRNVWGEKLFKTLMRATSTLAVVAFFCMLLLNINYFSVKFRYITGLLTKEEYVLEIGGQ